MNKPSRLKRLRTALGLTQAELARRVGIHQSLYGLLENGKQSPVNQKTGDWRKDVLKLVLYYGNFGVLLEDIFPEHASGPGEEPEGIDLAHQVSTHTYRMLMEGPDEALARKELQRRIVEVLDTLTAREAKIMIMRFGLNSEETETLEDIGKLFEVTKERIRQVEAKALRTLRQPSRAKRLRDFVEAE